MAGICLIIIHHHHPGAHHCRCHLDRSQSLFFFVPDWLDQEMLVKSNKSFLPEELLLSPGCAAFLYEETRRPRTFFASTFQHTPTYLRKNEKIKGILQQKILWPNFIFWIEMWGLKITYTFWSQILSPGVLRYSNMVVGFRAAAEGLRGTATHPKISLWRIPVIIRIFQRMEARAR